MGFQKPSRIQETILPLLMASPHHNTIAQSQSGTGKTAAFLISSLKRVDASANYPQVLILSPTLELAMQTADVARKMCKFAGITVRHVTKGEMRPRGELVEHVLVGTPGKFVDWLFRFKSFDIKRIKVFVLDEADIMIDLQGHREQSMVRGAHYLFGELPECPVFLVVNRQRNLSNFSLFRPRKFNKISTRTANCCFSRQRITKTFCSSPNASSPTRSSSR